jgi:hypothetical protein
LLTFLTDFHALSCLLQIATRPDHYKLDQPVILAADVSPHMMLHNVVRCSASPHRARLVELLLQQGLGKDFGLEEYNEHGETVLHAAANFGDAKVRTATVSCRVMLLCCLVR